MTDNLNNQTPSLDLDKPKRGRPATGKAMTAAEKQKAYRDRKKAQQEDIKSSAEAYESLQQHYDWLYNDRERVLQENRELKSGNVTGIKFAIRTRSKGKRKWEADEKEILWDSMEEAIETVKIMQKENEKRGWGFEYKIEPASEFIGNFIREFK